jgi:hypothetical protein
MLSATIPHLHDRDKGAAERGQHRRKTAAGNEPVKPRGLARIAFTPVLVQLRFREIPHEPVERRLCGLRENATEETELHHPLTPIIPNDLGFGVAAPAAAAISNPTIAASAAPPVIVKDGAVSFSLCSPRSAQSGELWLPKFIELV